jgi:hypothetical protein
MLVFEDFFTPPQQQLKLEKARKARKATILHVLIASAKLSHENNKLFSLSTGLILNI